MGKSLLAAGGAVDLGILSGEIEHALNTGSPVERELELGSRVYLVRVIPRPASGLTISFMDATERLSAARHAQRLAAILNDSNDAITVQAADGSIIAWNRGAERMYGYSEAEALTMNISETVPENNRDDARHLLERILGGDDIRTLDTVRRCKDGREIDVAVAVTALVNEAGDPYAIATTERDMTREREAVFAHDARLATAGEMAAGLAHELNQPLTSIVHFCDLALSIARASRTARRGELIEALEDTAEQAQRAGDIIRNLRRFVGRREAVRAAEDVNIVIRETVHFTEPELKSSGVSVHLALAEGLPMVEMDRTQIEQVLVNLIRNSVEAMVDAASDPCEIAISSQSVTSTGFASIEVTIVDSGPGVAPETVDRLFGPFHTSKPNGLGMGLWISRSIVEAHGGRLWADLDSGPGAKFHFSLPAADEGSESP
jgi:two-component system sensor kinase FixL